MLMYANLEYQIQGVLMGHVLEKLEEIQIPQIYTYKT